MELLGLPAVLRCTITPRIAFTAHQYRAITTEIYNPYTNNELLPPPPPVQDSATPEPSPPLLTLQSATLNLYNIHTPPNPVQLKYSSQFFASAEPSHILFSAARFRLLPPSSHPEVAFLGRSNVGKSSLLNALFNRTTNKLAHVSKRPGRTRTMNGFGVGGELFGIASKAEGGGTDGRGNKAELWKRFGRGGIVVVDMPGYGGGSREEWGSEIIKYLEQRKQLRRTFLLVDAEHGLKRNDVELLTHLREKGISHQVVLSKVDKIIYPGASAPGPQKLSNMLIKLREICSGMQLRLQPTHGRQRRVLGDVLCCSAEKGLEMKGRKSKLGIDELRWAVLSATGMECDERGEAQRYAMEDVDVLEED